MGKLALKNKTSIQIRDHHQHNAYEVLQDAIFTKTGVKCSVFVSLQYVSIRAASYVDFVLAKKAIKGRVSVEVVQG